MENFINKVVELCTEGATKVLIAIVAYVIGKMIIKKLLKLADKLMEKNQIDASLRTFTSSALRAVLYVVLVVTIIGILGIPMASVVAVLASAGLAIGMSLQGALGNLAGGIMLMVFKPFKVGDYVVTAGAEGIVDEITLFYTNIVTKDERKIIVPNGSLMNANVENYSAQENRRVDLTFTCERGVDVQKVEDIIYGVMDKCDLVLKDPAPFVGVTGATDTATEFTVRPFCKNDDYWDTYFYMTKHVGAALGDAGIQAPAVRVVKEDKQ